MKKILYSCIILASLSGCIQLDDSMVYIGPNENLVSKNQEENLPPEDDTLSVEKGNWDDDPVWEEEIWEVEGISLVHPVEVRASSVLPDQGDVSYIPEITIDGDVYYAWVEDVPGPGRNEWIEFVFDGPQEIGEVQIYNGYGRSFENNGYMTKMKLSFSDGTEKYYACDPHWTFAIFDEPIVTDSMRVTILETSDHMDTAISEVVFQNRSEMPVTPELTKEEQIYVPSLQERITSLGALGNVTTMTEAQARAFAQVIRDVDASNIWFFDGGDGVPVMYLRGNAVNLDGSSVGNGFLIYQWNGTEAILYTLPPYEDISFVITGILEQNGKYYLDIGTTSDTSRASWESGLLMSFYNGMVVEKPEYFYFRLNYYVEDTENLARDAMSHRYLKYMGFTSNHELFQQLIQIQENFHIKDGVWKMGTYNHSGWAGYKYALTVASSGTIFDSTGKSQKLSTSGILEILDIIGNL